MTKDIALIVRNIMPEHNMQVHYEYFVLFSLVFLISLR